MTPPNDTLRINESYGVIHGMALSDQQYLKCHSSITGVPFGGVIKHPLFY
jgi:hypothetical protein